MTIDNRMPPSIPDRLRSGQTVRIPIGSTGKIYGLPKLFGMRVALEYCPDGDFVEVSLLENRLDTENLRP